jgi:hypothetical protein
MADRRTTSSTKPRTFIDGQRLGNGMLIAVVDRAGRGGTKKVKDAFEVVERRYAELGHGLKWPVSAEIVPIQIMGASKSLNDRHTLYVSVRAVESDLLEGLVAHEVGHMLRTEARHASHNPDVYRRVSKEVRIPRAAEGAFSNAFNHIQDIYADDLSFPVFAGSDGRRAYDFFAAWVDNNIEMEGKNRWQNLGLAATNGFALGALIRHELIGPRDPLWDRARAFDKEAGFQAVDGLAKFYATLPPDPSPQDFVAHVQRLAGILTTASNA